MPPVRLLFSSSKTEVAPKRNNIWGRFTSKATNSSTVIWSLTSVFGSHTWHQSSLWRPRKDLAFGKIIHEWVLFVSLCFLLRQSTFLPLSTRILRTLSVAIVPARAVVIEVVVNVTAAYKKCVNSPNQEIRGTESPETLPPSSCFALWCMLSGLVFFKFLSEVLVVCLLEWRSDFPFDRFGDCVQRAMGWDIEFQLTSWLLKGWSVPFDLLSSHILVGHAHTQYGAFVDPPNSTNTYNEYIFEYLFVNLKKTHNSHLPYNFIFYFLLVTWIINYNLFWVYIISTFPQDFRRTGKRGQRYLREREEAWNVVIHYLFYGDLCMKNPHSPISTFSWLLKFWEKAIRSGVAQSNCDCRFEGWPRGNKLTFWHSAGVPVSNAVCPETTVTIRRPFRDNTRREATSHRLRRGSKIVRSSTLNALFAVGAEIVVFAFPPAGCVVQVGSWLLYLIERLHEGTSSGFEK